MPLLTPAAAQERLADAPIDAVSHRRVESVIDFVATMLIGATRRSNGDGRVRRWCAHHFKRSPRAMSGIASFSYLDDGEPFTAMDFLSSIAFEKVGTGVPFPAI
jgi:hypothetical protein